MRKNVLLWLTVCIASLYSGASAQTITAVRQPLTAFVGIVYTMSVDYRLPVGISNGKIEVISKNTSNPGQVRAFKEVSANSGTCAIEINPNYHEVAKLWDIRLSWQVSAGKTSSIVYTTLVPLNVYVKPAVTVKPNNKVILLPDAEDIDPVKGGYYTTSKAITVTIANLPAGLVNADRPTVILSGGNEQVFSFNDPELTPFTAIRSITQPLFTNQAMRVYAKLPNEGDYVTSLKIKVLGYTIFSGSVVCSSIPPDLVDYTFATINNSVRRYNIISPLSNASVLNVVAADSVLSNRINVLVDKNGSTSEVNLASNALLMSRSMTLVRDMPNSKWYFFSFPYEVKTNEMEIIGLNKTGEEEGEEDEKGQAANLYNSGNPAASPKANIWICQYSGTIRANGFTPATKNNTWPDIITHRTLAANESFAVCIPANAKLRIRSSSTAEYILFKGKGTHLTATPHPVVGLGSDGFDNDWNLMANPFLQRISSKDIDAPAIHRYNSQTDTYTIALNNGMNGLELYLEPFQPVFIQASGSIAYSFVEKMGTGPRAQSRSVAWDTKSRVDLELTNGARLVVVENPEASPGYVYGEDGLYMGSMNSGTQNIYSTTLLPSGKVVSVSVMQQPSIASVPVRLTGGNNTITLGQYSNLENIAQVLLCNAAGAVLVDLKQVDSYTTSATSLTLKVVNNPTLLGEATNGQGYRVSYQQGKAVISGAEGKSIIVSDLMGGILFRGVAPDHHLEIETSGRIVLR